MSVFVNFPKEALGNVPEHAALVGQSIRTAASLTDMPTNELYTDAYVEIARATAARLGCDIRVRMLTMRALQPVHVYACVADSSSSTSHAQVIRGEELRELGLGGIYGMQRLPLTTSVL